MAAGRQELAAADARGDAAAALECGARLFEQGDLAAAAEAFRQAMAIEGRTGTAARNLATVLALGGDAEAALAVLGGILRQSPDDDAVLAAVREILTSVTTLSPVAWLTLVSDLRWPRHDVRAQGEELERLRGENRALRAALERLKRRPAAAAPARESDETGLPVPPPALRARVHGDRRLDTFNGVGRAVVADLEAALAATPLAAEPELRVLDFGCGSGRIARWLHGAHPRWRYHGTDIDAEAIDWCRQQLAAIGRFGVNRPWPPLGDDDESFDFVYSISIFTHLPEDMQLAWLAELRRVTRRGGYLVLTTHGEALHRRMFGADAAASAEFEARGFRYVMVGKTEGLPDFYRAAFHAERYLREVWGRFFTIERIVERGIAGHQDLVLCRRGDD